MGTKTANLGFNENKSQASFLPTVVVFELKSLVIMRYYVHGLSVMVTKLSSGTD